MILKYILVATLTVVLLKGMSMRFGAKWIVGWRRDDPARQVGLLGDGFRRHCDGCRGIV